MSLLLNEGIVDIPLSVRNCFGDGAYAVIEMEVTVNLINYTITSEMYALHGSTLIYLLKDGVMIHNEFIFPPEWFTVSDTDNFETKIVTFTVDHPVFLSINNRWSKAHFGGVVNASKHAKVWTEGDTSHTQNAFEFYEIVLPKYIAP